MNALRQVKKQIHRAEQLAIAIEEAIEEQRIEIIDGERLNRAAVLDALMHTGLTLQKSERIGVNNLPLRMLAWIYNLDKATGRSLTTEKDESYE